MSDSASRKDVEDVLSSVRRLVSSEVPRNRRPDLPRGPGALVLTDAQRVEKPSQPKGPAAKSLEDRIAELEAAVSSRDDEYEPDGSEDQAQHRPDRIVYSRPPDEVEQARARGDALRLSRLSLVRPGATPRAEPEADQEPDVSPRASFRHNRRAEATVASGDTAPEKEAPMAEDVTEDAPPKAEVRAFRDPDDMIGRFEARMDGADMPPPPGPGHNGFSERLEPYEVSQARAAEKNAPVTDELAELQDADEDADAEADFEAALSKAVADPADRDRPAADRDPAKVAPAGSAADAAAAVAPDASDDTLEDDDVLGDDDGFDDVDEDLLRPLVAKLIREELQGELGERITRNVRKLVRREILRAMSSREFE